MQPDSFADYHVSCGLNKEGVSKNKLLVAHFYFDTSAEQLYLVGMCKVESFL